MLGLAPTFLALPALATLLRAPPRIVVPEHMSLPWADHRPPARSALASLPRRPAPEVTEDMLRSYDQDGFIVLRNAIDPAVLEIMLQESQRLCTQQLHDFAVCRVRNSRWSNDVARDFLAFGPLGQLAAAFLRAATIRVKLDMFIGFEHRPRHPDFFSFTGHIDNNAGTPGFYGGLHPNASGVTAWIPLHDLDADTEGGSVSVWRGFPASDCKFVVPGPVKLRPRLKPSEATARSCEEWARAAGGVEATKATLSFRRGDLVFWHPWMMHQTQEVKRAGFTRYAYFAYLIDGDAVLCTAVACGGKAFPCCRGNPERPGSKLQHPCYLEIHPHVLPSEEEAHFAPWPRPLVDEKGRMPRGTWAPECY